MAQVHEHIESELSAAQMTGIIRLINQSWPDSKRSIETQVAQALRSAALQDRSTRRFVIWDDDIPLAHARIFPRTVTVSGRDLTVMALASVCVSTDRRGNGLGRAVVEEAFAALDDLELTVALFQTGVPKFYERLGCRSVHNHFFYYPADSSTPANPWSDEHVMIYPAEFPFPTGDVNMNGPGY